MNVSHAPKLTTLFVSATLAAGLTACGGDDESANNNAGNNNNTIQVPGTVLRSGALTNVDGTPSATGGVSIRTDSAGKQYIYLSPDFAQEMGPGDTEIRLAKAGTNAGDQIAADAASVTESLGVIPNGASGEFLFEIPASIDPSAFGFAIVWCPTAGVNFGVGQFNDAGNRTFAGTLTNVDGTPSATGSVTITETSPGTFTIALGADFAQEMGPGDTELRLAKADTNLADQLAADANSVTDALGIIPNAATGAQSFEVTGIEPSDFSHVVIWCPTAAVNFGAGTFAASN